MLVYPTHESPHVPGLDSPFDSLEIGLICFLLYLLLLFFSLRFHSVFDIWWGKFSSFAVSFVQ